MQHIGMMPQMYFRRKSYSKIWMQLSYINISENYGKIHYLDIENDILFFGHSNKY